MNLNVPGMLLLMGGLLLVYAAVTNKDPREIARQAFGGPTPTTPISQPIATTPTVPPGSNTVWV